MAAHKTRLIHIQGLFLYAFMLLKILQILNALVLHFVKKKNLLLNMSIKQSTEIDMGLFYIPLFQSAILHNFSHRQFQTSFQNLLDAIITTSNTAG